MQRADAFDLCLYTLIISDYLRVVDAPGGNSGNHRYGYENRHGTSVGTVE